KKVGEIEYGKPKVRTASVAMARCAPFSLTTMPIISTSSGGSSAFRTSSESVICGTAFAETKLTASMCLKPAEISALRYVVFSSAGIWPLRPCQASRGHSISLTESLISCLSLSSRASNVSDQRRYCEQQCKYLDQKKNAAAN